MEFSFFRNCLEKVEKLQQIPLLTEDPHTQLIPHPSKSVCSFCQQFGTLCSLSCDLSKKYAVQYPHHHFDLYDKYIFELMCFLQFKSHVGVYVNQSRFKKSSKLCLVFQSLLRLVRNKSILTIRLQNTSLKQKLNYPKQYFKKNYFSNLSIVHLLLITV